MPILHHIGSTREERIHVLAQLSVVGWPLVPARPARPLGIGLCDEEVMATAHHTHEVARIADPHPILSILHGVIDIDGGILHLSHRLHLVDIGKSRHETVGDKLIRTFILVDQIDLPVEEIGCYLAVPSFPPDLVGGIGHPFPVVEIFPFVDVHAPIVQSPTSVEFFQIPLELLTDIGLEAFEIVGIVNASRLHLVIHLITDDGRMLGKVRHHASDDAFAIDPIGRVVDIHVLADAIIALSAIHGLRQHFGMLLCQPGGNGVGGGSQDDLNTCLVHGIQNTVHPGELKDTILRLKERPGRFAHPDNSHSGLFHQADIFVQTVGGRIFRIVGGPIERLAELIDLFLIVRLCQETASGYGSSQQEMRKICFHDAIHLLVPFFRG